MSGGGNTNHRQKGSRRDKEIILTVEKYGVLDADQVRVLFFRDILYGRRKAQERLLKLFQRGKLQRDREGDEAYFYYLERPGMVAHSLAVNWVRLYLQFSCRSWEKFHSFSYEQDYGILRADGFAAVKNNIAGAFRFCFVELDRGTNQFDKIELYNRLFRDGDYSGHWWVKLANRFPTVLVVTVSAARERQIEELIQERNEAGLEFKIMLLENVKKEVLQKCRG